MSQFIMSGLIVGLIGMLLWTPYLMCRGVCSLEGELTFMDKVLCAIPLFNIIRAEKKYYGKFSLVAISIVTFFIGFVVRFLTWRYMYQNATVGTITYFMFWAVILFYFIANMRFVFNVIHDVNATTGLSLFALTIFYPFGQYYIGTYLGNVMKAMQRKEKTFK